VARAVRDRRLEVSAEHDPVLVGAVVIRMGGRAVQPLRARPVVDAEAEGPVEGHRGPVSRPRHGLDPPRPATRKIGEGALVQGPAQATAPSVRFGADHVDVPDRGIVLADERHHEPGESTVGSFDDPRRSAEMLEPQPREQHADPPAAPPIVDHVDDPGMVGRGGPPER